jgi:hypothetical protein
VNKRWRATLNTQSARFICTAVALHCAAALANNNMPVAKQRIEEAIARLKSANTLDERAGCARKIEELSRRAKIIDDSTMSEVIALLDSPDDAVRTWIAGAVGHFGPRAISALPKLRQLLPEAECHPLGPWSDGAIRVAIGRITGKRPPFPDCTNRLKPLHK